MKKPQKNEVKVVGFVPRKTINGLWFYDDCAFTTDGQMLLPDADGVIQYAGEIYVLARKGREADFSHGRPQMRPAEYLAGVGVEPWMKNIETLTEVKLDVAGWVQEDARALPVLSGFFRETCRRFYDTVGSLGGWMSIGSALGYAAGPEFFDYYGCLPAIFLPGQMGSGKTFYTNWLMGFQGYAMAKGLGLGKGSRVTPVGLCQQLENYSCLMVWFDEYRQYEISDEKVSIIRDSYDRQLAGKWTPDGVQRVIRTTPIVSGETDTSDAATRSRYTHLQISAAQRKANHVDWMRENRQYFFFFWRHLMTHRAEYVDMVMRLASDWFTSEDTKVIPERSRVAHSLAYAAFAAATVLFESHSPEELSAYRKFMIEKAQAASEDVSSDINVNVFLQDVITAVKAEAIPPECFRVEKDTLEHPPGCPHQGPWESFRLYLDPKSIIRHLEIYLRKAGHTVTLRYNDLRDQLSKNEFWIKPEAGKKLNRRFGKKGQTSVVQAWGILVDKHPLGFQPVSDEDYRAALSDRNPTLDEIGPVFADGDPRRGELYAVIDMVLKAEARARQEERQ